MAQPITKSNGTAAAGLMAQRLTATSSPPFALALLLLALVSSRADGDVGVVLDESLNSSAEWVMGTGHAAVYFSRICAESPVRLRLCRPGEAGSVMSTYLNLGENQRYEWNIVPLAAYVYGVRDTGNRPLFGSEKVKALLEQRYRDRVLSPYCSGQDCKTNDKANWREMVGAGMLRSMYIFVVKTTLRQDLDLIAKFNALPNENHFNIVTRNCADFAKYVLDTYFPHAAHRDFINDFGMTSPKAVARSFTHYALSHPRSQFRILHFSQSPGTFKRSSEVRNGTEQLYHAKKLLVPMVIFADHALPVVAAAHVLTGRFNPEREFEEHPAVLATPARYQIRAADTGIDDARGERLRAVEVRDPEEVVGTPKEWKRYNQEFDLMVNEALREEVIPSREYLDHFFKYLDQSGKPFTDGKGALWMEVSEGDATKVGVSVNNIFAPGSDPWLAFTLLLARVHQVLKSPRHRRETLIEFKEDWALLEYARVRTSEATAIAGVPRSPLSRTAISAVGAE
jgi:hypothetical protein